MPLLAILLSVGVFAVQDPQDACADVGGQLEMTSCYADVRDRAKAEQGVILSRINRALDALPADHGVEPREAKRAFSEAQSHWNAFATADCGAGEALFGDGGAFALDSLDCEITHLEDRNRQLRDFESRYLGR
ncbi:lysozyme inhibitor LprI family protein [Brevundimonas sp.]|uniref:lysozyme inhibitor LprI family protein n=1 Tax=Brevundimonas sp. TaxID=1871086 RepID=UPI0025BF7FDB|nr:lysozyme inhibitor LprI family protein [Brevundimonas sp.]